MMATSRERIEEAAIEILEKYPDWLSFMWLSDKLCGPFWAYLKTDLDVRAKVVSPGRRMNYDKWCASGATGLDEPEITPAE